MEQHEWSEKALESWDDATALVGKSGKIVSVAGSRIYGVWLCPGGDLAWLYIPPKEQKKGS